MPQAIRVAASATQIQEAGRCMRRQISPLIGEGSISKNHCCWKTVGAGAGPGSFLSVAGLWARLIVGDQDEDWGGWRFIMSAFGPWLAGAGARPGGFDQPLEKRLR